MNENILLNTEIGANAKEQTVPETTKNVYFFYKRLAHRSKQPVL